MKKKIQALLPVLIVCLFAACNLQGSSPESPPEATLEVPTGGDLPLVLTPTETIVHLMRPGEGASVESSIADTISGDTATQGVPNEPPGGDMYMYNLYERPFNAFTQDVFFPDLDIRSAQLGLKDPWMYVTIQLYGLDPATGTLARHYGIEIDLNVDGRGDWLILADAPLEPDWTTTGVRVWHDTNTNVGQLYVCLTDPPQTMDSYDLLYFDQGIGDDPDAAWARFIAGTPPALQIAFKHSMIGLDDKFMWGVWADQGVDMPAWFDYHDHFTYEEAGAPFTYLTDYYPIKAIAEVDNTCRMAYGFTLVGNEPCLCAGNVKTPTPSPAPYARLGGYIWKDSNGNGVYDGAGTDGGMGDVTVQVRSGACPGGAVVASALSGAWGRYDVENLVPGTYCVRPVPMGSIFFSPEQTQVTLAPGEFRDNVNFRVMFTTIP